MPLITLVVKDDANASISVEVDARERVNNVRALVAQKMRLPKDVRLLFAGRLLRNETVLDQAGVLHQSTLYVLRPADQLGPGVTNFSEMPENLLQLQNHLLLNPDIMQQMMNSPAMQSLLNDMRFLKNILSLNPKVRHLMGPTSELQKMFDDPSFVQQALDAFRNPSMMRDLLRSTDSAMAGLNQIPGGGTGVIRKLYDALEGRKREVNPEAEKPSREFDTNAMAAMMQDPNLQQLLATSFSTVDEHNPLGKPQVLAQLYRPANMAAVAAMEESIASLALGKATKENAAPAPHFSATFSSFLQAQKENPELQYRTQLHNLRHMGFTDTEKCIQALIECGGGVQASIDKMLEDARGIA
eukprot:GEMP01031925.1.p1 GENE.GEMP01031925.1~~GEMP01031925.1.p1  ORF type:complete len:357 (+),score=91.17 GEMP01031925.1:92-1162(+)